MKKITIAGNSLADIIKRIDAYPGKGMLCKISEVIPGVGGCVPNTGITLKTLAPAELEVAAISRLGDDENGKFVLNTLKNHGLDVGRMIIDKEHPTSFTDVMTLPNGERTFFCAPAANDAFCEEDVRVDTLDCSLFHIGYLLLLKTLDEPDEEYGTKMARLLSKVQARGISTSIDVVSAEGERFAQVIRPALQYPLLDLGIVLEEIVYRRIRRVKIRRAVCYDGRYAVVNLRNDEVKQRGDKQQHDDLGEDERKHARKLCSCFKARLCFVYAQNKRLKKLALVKRHRRDEKIGYDKTPYKRA